MTRSSSRRVLRRQVKRGVIDEIKLRTGRDASEDSDVRRLIQERILAKERAVALPDVKVDGTIADEVSKYDPG